MICCLVMKIIVYIWMKGLVLDRITCRVSLPASWSAGSAYSDRASVCIKARFLWIIISKATCKAMLTLATDTGPGESYQDYSFSAATQSLTIWHNAFKSPHFACSVQWMKQHLWHRVWSQEMWIFPELGWHEQLSATVFSLGNFSVCPY